MANRAELSLRASNVGIDPAAYANDSKLEQRVIWEERNAADDTGTLATGTLTSDDTDMEVGDTVTVGVPGGGNERTYTFIDALTEAYAAAVLTVSDQFSEGETVSVGGVQYIFKAIPVNPNDIDIGSTAAVSLDNLKVAINAGSGEGTAYGTGTVANPLVEATTNTDTAQTVQALQIGVQGNGIAVSTNAADGAWGADLTAGGVDPVDGEVLIGAGHAAALDNFKSAVNGTAGAGTVYATGTEAHAEVTATTNDNTSQVLAAISYNSGNSVATTDNDPDHLSFGAGTLTGGVPDTVGPASSAVQATSGGARV